VRGHAGLETAARRPDLEPAARGDRLQGDPDLCHGPDCPTSADETLEGRRAVIRPMDPKLSTGEGRRDGFYGCGSRAARRAR
jgi:hypothetical protein